MDKETTKCNPCYHDGKCNECRMPVKEKVIKGLECCMKWTGEPNTATCHCSDCSYINMDILGQRCLIDLINDALALLKEQEDLGIELTNAVELIHKKNERIEKLLKEQDAVEGHWIVLEFCANEGIYCSRCMNKIFDRSTKPKKKLSNYCPNCGSKNTHFFNPSTEKIMYSD